jgi:hypothetical protein
VEVEEGESMMVGRVGVGSVWVGRGGVGWEACRVAWEGGSARASEAKQADVEGCSMVLEKGQQVHGV